jgi:hypothetical protein
MGHLSIIIVEHIPSSQQFLSFFALPQETILPHKGTKGASAPISPDKEQLGSGTLP